MNGHVFPRRATWVWIGLVLATCTTWWLGGSHPFASGNVRFASAAAIAIAFAKAYFIGIEFMELRSAPKTLRRAFEAWTAVVGSVTVLLIVY
ncbi:cytochrome C oxidase subunit IV family protein [Nocardia sp. NPDC057663]|uniref:cytochrome C oxidase subunit IV family protein n=1 Tax=Nocardia sp. NPDC057663 TaxID=3346201 RepID=UPI003670F3B4